MYNIVKRKEIDKDTVIITCNCIVRFIDIINNEEIFKENMNIDVRYNKRIERNSNLWKNHKNKIVTVKRYEISHKSNKEIEEYITNKKYQCDCKVDYNTNLKKDGVFFNSIPSHVTIAVGYDYISYMRRNKIHEILNNFKDEPKN